MNLYKQMTSAKALSDFMLISGRSRLRVKLGDSFTIVNSTTDQSNTGAYQISRSKTAKIGQGYYIFPSIFTKNFEVI